MSLPEIRWVCRLHHKSRILDSLPQSLRSTSERTLEVLLLFKLDMIELLEFVKDELVLVSELSSSIMKTPDTIFKRLNFCGAGCICNISCLSWDRWQKKLFVTIFSDTLSQSYLKTCKLSDTYIIVFEILEILSFALCDVSIFYYYTESSLRSQP